MGRVPCCEKIGLRKGRWTREEDEILINYIQAHGEGSWRSLPKHAGLLRCGKSCRLRWMNYLRADLKRGNITLEEQHLILQLHSTLGNRWSLIARQLPGRTDNEIKNYWNSHVSKTIAAAAADTAGVSNSATANKKRKGGATSRLRVKKDTTLMSLSSKRSDDSTCPERDEDEDDVLQGNLIMNGLTTSTVDTGGNVMEVGEADDEAARLLGLGPYEWLDSEMMMLDEFLPQGLEGLEEIERGDGVPGTNHGSPTEIEKALVATELRRE